MTAARNPPLQAGGREGDPRALRFVEFPDGKGLLAALVDENIHSVVHRVCCTGLHEPAALAYSVEHPRLAVRERADVFRKVLATHGGESQVISPHVPAELWRDPGDVLLGVELEPELVQASPPATDVLLLLDGAEALRATRDLLLSFGITFHLGLIADPETFFVVAELDRPGSTFILEVLGERKNVTRLQRRWQTTGTSVALYVEAGFRHPYEAVLARMAQARERFADFEQLLCLRSRCLRAVVRPEALLAYRDTIRPQPPRGLRSPERVQAAASSRILDKLAESQLDRVEVRVERTSRRRGASRRAATLDSEVAMLRLELLSLSQRLQEINHLSGQAPVIYGYRGKDVAALRLLIRNLPSSEKARLLCATIAPRPDGLWLFLLAANPIDVVRLPASGPEWLRFFGQCDADSPQPLIYVPEGYQLSPSLSTIGARRFGRLLGSELGLDGGSRWSLLLPEPDATGTAWRLLLLSEDACRPVLHGLSTLSLPEWLPLLPARLPDQPPAAAPWAPAFDEYERAMVGVIATRIGRLEERVRELVPKAGRLIEEIGRRSNLLSELYDFERRVKAGHEAALRNALVLLEDPLRRFEQSHTRLAGLLRGAINTRSDVTELLAACQELVEAEPGARAPDTAGHHDKTEP